MRCDVGYGSVGGQKQALFDQRELLTQTLVDRMNSLAEMRVVAAIVVALGQIIPAESHGQAVVVQYARHVNGPPIVMGDSGRSYAIADRTIETLSTDPRPTYLVKVNVESIDDVRAIHAMAQDLSRALEQEAARASVDFVAIWAIVATSAGPINHVKRWGFTFERDSKGVWAEVHPPSAIK